ncbi:dehypoxanthine futalosine cyclase [Peptococcaceae bacterium]|nr:dehypoxanthine futalosine cyclase [Peptococcaceae bacterium]
MPTDLELIEKAISGGRLELDEAVQLLASKDSFLLLAQAANIIRKKLHPDDVVTFVIDRNINYTNVCLCKCKFCAFWKDEGDKDAYVLDKEQIFKKIEETIAAGGTAVLIQGGLSPKLGLDYYLDLVKSIKERYDIHIHSFSPPEIVHMALKSGLSVEEVLIKLKEAGLDSIPGGGAEILVDRVRKIISPNKISWKEWMYVMECAHKLGMKTTATMMFGHVETYEERVLHMIRIRELQDKTEGFTAFIPWTFQPKNTELGGKEAGSVEYLKTLALSRLVLDNIKNIQASWVTQGMKVAAVALSFGANDLGSTMLEENVVRATGVINRTSVDEMVYCIKNAGFKPAQRMPSYGIVKYL